MTSLVGKRFGRWYVLRRSNRHEHNVLWVCRCSCNSIRNVSTYSLCSGTSQSCGCLQRELQARKMLGNVYGEKSRRHGDTHVDGKRTKEYLAWRAMQQRCSNRSQINYENYGGRGIRVCKRWLGVHGYENFLEDMGRAPSPEHSIDRKNNDGNYTPLNCRWATVLEQRHNRRAA